jgi:GNAT superfamily N-acetyltransferase
VIGSEFDIRSYVPGDEIHILKLFRQSFGRDLSKERWSWRYEDNPAGAGLIGLAWHGDVLVAHHSISRVMLCIDGHEWTVGLGRRAMTHPQYRGRGLYVELARRTWARMAELGMPMALAFPNSFTHRLVVRDMGFVDVHEVPTLRLPMHSGSFLPAPSAHIVELQDFDDRFDQLWRLARGEYRIITRRNREHLVWRYVRNPTGQYRILAYMGSKDLLGYAVFKRYQEELQVIDILTVQDVGVGIQLILRIAQLALEESASALSLWLNMSHPLHWALEKLGFRNGEPIAYFTARILRPELVEDAVYDYRNWYLTMGDSDVF